MKAKLLGFTLAELLIALSVLGIIAAFTLPKVLTNTQNAAYNAEAKEVAALLSKALTQLKLQYDGRLPDTAAGQDLLQFIHSVEVYTGQINGNLGPVSTGVVDCSSATATCVRLVNGGVLATFKGSTRGTFCDENTKNAGKYRNYTIFIFDADGFFDGDTTSWGNSVRFFLNGNNYIDTDLSGSWHYVTSSAGSNCANNVGPSPSSLPAWFTWP